MSAASIYAALRAHGMSEAGACALLGNMEAESALRSDNAQDGMTGLSDEQYTRAVDSGLYGSFTGDGVGYGLCQWTYPGRKQALLAYALNSGRSIGDEAMQVEFAVKELRQDYPALWQFLCRTDDSDTAAARICREFERPAVNNIACRAEAARRYMAELAGNSPVPSPPAEEKKYPAEMAVLCRGFCGTQVSVLQALLCLRGHACPVNGEFGEDTLAAVIAFQAAQGLAADGIAGKNTVNSLCRVGKERS